MLRNDFRWVLEWIVLIILQRNRLSVAGNRFFRSFFRLFHWSIENKKDKSIFGLKSKRKIICMKKKRKRSIMRTRAMLRGFLEKRLIPFVITGIIFMFILIIAVAFGYRFSSPTQLTVILLVVIGFFGSTVFMIAEWISKKLLENTIFTLVDWIIKRFLKWKLTVFFGWPVFGFGLNFLGVSLYWDPFI